MLARGDATGGMEGFAESAAAGVLGPVEPLKAAIGRLFPALEWKFFDKQRPDGSAGSSWFGLQGPPEFHLMVEPDGQVRFLGMSHCERVEVEQVARALRLVAFDMQS